MARIRTIKPDFWRNPELSQVSPEAALLAIGLLNIADDEGWFLLNEKLIQADVFPLRELSRSTTVVLRELSDIGYFEVFSTPENRLYGHVVNFSKHQVINNKSTSKISCLELLPYSYGSPTVALPSGKEGKGREKDIPQNAFAEESLNVEPQNTVNETEVMFNTIWDLYGKKVDRAIALKSFSRLKATPELFERICSAVRVYVKSNPDVKFRKHMATYLNNRCWEDEVSPPADNLMNDVISFHTTFNCANTLEEEFQRML